MSGAHTTAEASRVSKVVLIVGQATDPHVERVRQTLQHMGAAVFVVDPHASATTTHISFSFRARECYFEARADGCEIVGRDISAVWWRLKPGPVWPGQSHEMREMHAFRAREWQHALEGLEAALAGAHWINPRSADRRARHKGVQLLEATRLGFTIPPTLISNDPERVSGRLQSWGEKAIYKPFTPYFPPPDKAVYTSRVDSNLIGANAESVELAPGIFQELIEKEYELRITVVGNSVFAVRIESQDSPTTVLDWRKDYDALAYSAVKLPAEVEQNLLRLHAALGLVFGAYDFIVTPSGEYIFLEVNPVGQWLWLEEAVGIGVSRALADLLACPG
jgi:glutathione synthase/RimK-type ligase-like ATP-grasp enzyme